MAPVFSVAESISQLKLLLSERNFLTVRTWFLLTQIMKALCDIVLPGRAFRALAIQ
jgi:hypothetical protein